MNWTEKQKEVIEARGCSLLVSAAAGSGKTAVLVERIIRLISEGEHPLDIDELLVMTFTNAAAAEMRERVGLAIERKLMEQPENEHLQAQAALVPHAQITTIDSFCLNLIREHFNLLDIDPAFRIGDEGELILMKADVMAQMLEEYYGRGDEVFEQFVDTYASGKSDSGIEDYIEQIYKFAQSNPFPAKWAHECRRELQMMDDGDLMSAGWMRYLMDDMRHQFDELVDQYAQAIDICGEADGPEVYLPNLIQEYEMLKGLAGVQDYEELYSALGNVEFGRLKAARSKDIDPVKKVQVTECRDRVKKIIGDMKKAYGAQTQEEAITDILGTRDVVLKLLELAEEFSRRYQETKRDKNLVDFNDLEHYALQILVRESDETGSSIDNCKDDKSKDDKKICYTETADLLSRQYAEILVDEYQDSNYVQETLIQSLSGERFGRPNVFMVGDVKQSIYKFRLARPELFMEKYETYTTSEGSHRKIELHQNFRSRASVLESINQIFYQIMTKNLGNVEYTEDAALHSGAVFAEVDGLTSGERVGTPTELRLIDTGRESMGALDEETADYTAKELEAKMIAARIRQLTDPASGLLVWDKEKACYRTAMYGDMVILLRSMTGWSETLIQVLTREGIPAYAETSAGYFNTIEVETVLSMLAVIDNPMQDIPLATVLRSPMVGVNEEELAWMMANYKRIARSQQDRGIYGAFRYLVDQAADMQKNADYSSREHLSEQAILKLCSFDQLLSSLRYQATYLPIHELIYQVYALTGYYDYVSAMPAGETRRANLDMLIEKASAYEKTSYKGLFQFIRYINQLKKFETDFGEASTGKYENMIRVMSIHKSKGLEFPVVFLAAMGKQFNKQDTRGKLIIDSDLGIGTDFLDLKRRTRGETLKKLVLKRKMVLDSLGEELRVLYVAMTRAKEKLIMTGTDRSLEKKLEKWANISWQGQVPYTVLGSAGSYLDWVLMSHPQEKGLVRITQIPVETLVGEEVALQVKKRATKEELLSLTEYDLPDTAYGTDQNDRFERIFSYQYGYTADIDLHTKTTVSELKKLGQDIDDHQGLIQSAVPDYLNRSASGEASGEALEYAAPDEPKSKADRIREGKLAMKRAAERGTAYHRLLELLDFTNAGKPADVEAQIHSLESDHRITSSAASLIRPYVVWKLASSPMGKRMAKAQKLGRLHREQQFVMGIPAREMDQADSDELVLIQGIIDAWMEEDDDLVLIDYKTDRLSPGEEEVLVNRYRTQLDYYQKALEQMKKGKVKEKIIYSLSLQKEIHVDGHL